MTWRPRFRIPNPFPPIPMPAIHVGGTLGHLVGEVQNLINSITDFNYRNEYFDKLNDEAKKLVADMEGFVSEAGGISKDELVSTLIKRVTPQLTAETNGEMFNNIFQNESVALFREHYASVGAQTCYFVVAGLMIAAVVILIVVAPETTLLVDGLIASAFIMAARGCEA